MSLYFMFQDFRIITTLLNTRIPRGVVGQVGDVSIVLVPRFQECNTTVKHCYNTGCSRASG